MLRLILYTALTFVAVPASAQSLEPLMPKIISALPPVPRGDVDDPRRRVDQGLFAHHAPMMEAVSGDKEWLLSHDQNGALNIRKADGEPELIVSAEGNFRWTVEGARLSDDGRWIAAKMIDDSMVYQSTITEREGNPKTVRFSYAGMALPENRLFILSRDGRNRAEIPLTMDYVYLAGFDSDGRGLRYLEANRIGRHVALRHFDFNTGQVTTLMEETSDDWTIAGYDLGNGYSTRFEDSNRLTLLDNERFLWMSDHGGERKVYAYAPGTPPQQVALPSDELLVDFIGIDLTAKIGFLHTVPRDNLWGRHRLYALDLGTLEATLITDANHIAFAEVNDGRVVFADTDLPASIVVRSVAYDGSDKSPPQAGDLSFLTEEPIRVEKLVLPGANGSTLRAVLVAPNGDGPFPLVDNLYGGPQTREAKADPVSGAYSEAVVLARNGIATVFIDARGTIHRSASFAHAQDGRFGEGVIADHAAAIRALLARDPALDPDRVGITGHSWGGYFTLRGMIEASDLFKAGIMLAPNTNVSEMRVPVEAYQGCLPDACPDAYEQGHMTSRLDELRGPLLIMHGTADDDVLSEITDKLEEDLKSAGASYEIVRPVGVDHIVMRMPGYLDRIVAFWKTTLADAAPD